MRGLGGKLAGALIGAAALVSVATASAEPFPGANQPPDCKFKNATITVDPHYWQPHIKRRGDEIVIGYGRNKAVRCKPAATVTNTDTIRIPAESDIDLTGGPFAPGASPEADASPEIEFDVGPAIDGPLTLYFGSGDDHVTAGVVGGRAIGVNLNPTAADTDADILLTPSRKQELEYSNLAFHTGAGNDLADLSGGNGFDERSRMPIGLVFAEGGDDTVLGAPGSDYIEGGSGSDLIASGRGPDFVYTRDNDADHVDCGVGRDTLSRDRRDKRAKGCEYNRLPSQDPPLPDPPHIPHARP